MLACLSRRRPGVQIPSEPPHCVFRRFHVMSSAVAHKDKAKHREYMRKYQRRWLSARRQAWFRAHGPCVRCGSWDDLEIDHIDPKTKITSVVWSWAEKRRDRELLKCQVLCHRCHVMKSIEARDWKLRPEAPEGESWCSSCHQFRPVADFGPDRSTRPCRNGLRSHCNPCRKASGWEKSR